VPDALSEAERLQLEANRAIADFVRVEIESGLTFCRIAKMEEKWEKRHHALEQARNACRIASNGIRKLKLTKEERGAFKLERLKADLRSANPSSHQGHRRDAH
jgi:hypothetical protein